MMCEMCPFISQAYLHYHVAQKCGNKTEGMPNGHEQEAQATGTNTKCKSEAHAKVCTNTWKTNLGAITEQDSALEH